MSVFIIAEAGVNHNGSISLAKKMIDVAAESGADAVKFQTFKAENLLVKNAQKAEYQKRNTDTLESQFNMIKKLELDVDMHRELMAYSRYKGIMFLSTPFDHDSINLLHELGLQIFKIPSGEITNFPYLDHIGSLGGSIILSTGMSNLKEVESALNVLIRAGTPRKRITVMHANTMYPTPMEDVNLKAMITMQDEFNVAIGYSDHTLGIEVDIAAVAMGASCIEKHFTLDRKMEGPDHKASLEPEELSAMVLAIRNIEMALGNGEKIATLSESANLKIARKSIVASKPIKKGSRFSRDNIAVKRPGGGISPMKWNEVLDTIATRDYCVDELI